MTGANRIILEIEECLFRKNKLQINEKRVSKWSKSKFAKIKENL
ncbi:MAG: hypothetical protein SPE82_07800 [Succinivibrio sp.]|nr:hypothetical protein [Succinivibrio sp.]